MEAPPRQIKVQSSDSYSQRSLRSIANSKYSNKYDIQKIFNQKQKLNNETQKNIKDLYDRLQNGAITAQQCQNQIKNELHLHQKPNLRNQLKKVDVHYNDLIQGIEQQEPVSRYLLKPNTYDKQLLQSNKDQINSLLAYQQARSEQIKYDPQNEIQKISLDQANKLIRGQIDLPTFKENIKDLGINTPELNKNIKELETCNQTQKGKLEAKILRALSQQQNVNHYNSAYHPDKAQIDRSAVHNNLKYYAAENPSTEAEQDEWIKTKQHRMQNGTNAYNQVLKRGQYYENDQHNGNFLTWNDYQNPKQQQLQKSLEQFRPALSNIRNMVSLKSNLSNNLEVQQEEDQQDQYKRQQGIKKHNLMFKSSENFMSHNDSQQPQNNLNSQKLDSRVSNSSHAQKKADFLKGSGNIIAWG